MYNYYKYDRELSQEEQDDHNKLIELKLQHKREALARKYKDKVLKFIDSYSRNPIISKDEYYERFHKRNQDITKSVNFKKGHILESSGVLGCPSQLSTTINPRQSIMLRKESPVNHKCSEGIDPTPATLNECEAFYSQLRPRDRGKEIVQPLKLKIHSSLERVYNKLKERRHLDIGQTCTSYNENTISTVPVSKLGIYNQAKQKEYHPEYTQNEKLDESIISPLEKNITFTRNQMNLQEYLERRSKTQLMIKLQRTNSKTNQKHLLSPKHNEYENSSYIESTKASTVAANNIEDINLSVLKPLNVPSQTRYFRNALFPELHQERRYFKAAQTLLIRNQPENSPCTYKDNEDEYKFQIKFGKISKNPLIKSIKRKEEVLDTLLTASQEGSPKNSIDLGRNSAMALRRGQSLNDHQKGIASKRRNNHLSQSMQVEDYLDAKVFDIGPVDVNLYKAKQNSRYSEPFISEESRPYLHNGTKLTTLTKEMLLKCNVIRKKKVDMEHEQVLKILEGSLQDQKQKNHHSKSPINMMELKLKLQAN